MTDEPIDAEEMKARDVITALRKQLREVHVQLRQEVATRDAQLAELQRAVEELRRYTGLLEAQVSRVTEVPDLPAPIEIQGALTPDGRVQWKCGGVEGTAETIPHAQLKALAVHARMHKLAAVDDSTAALRAMVLDIIDDVGSAEARILSIEEALRGQG